LAVEPARAGGPFDFGRSDLAYRMAEEVRRLRLDQNVWRVPPPDILFLHRKLGGMYLICARLGARVDVGRLTEPRLEATSCRTGADGAAD
jgi:hypothetical protein